MTTPAGPSYVRQNYHPECEAAVNEQISLQLHAAYVFTSMASYFNRDDVALKHFSQFFRQRAAKERELAEELMELQNLRGGHTLLRDVGSPQYDDWECGLRALECAMCLAKKVNESLLHLHRLAAERNDAHLCGFLERTYLHQQVLFLKELADHVAALRSMGGSEYGMAEYLFDKLTLGRGQKD